MLRKRHLGGIVDARDKRNKESSREAQPSHYLHLQTKLTFNSIEN
jgi:hypothetical protein